MEEVEYDVYGGYRFARWKPSEKSENERDPSYLRIFIGLAGNLLLAILTVLVIAFVASLFTDDSLVFKNLFFVGVWVFINLPLHIDAKPTQPSNDKPTDEAVPIVCPRNSVPGWLYFENGWFIFKSSRYCFKLKKTDFTMDEAPGTELLSYEIGRFNLPEQYNLKPIRLGAIGKNQDERRSNQERIDSILRQLLSTDPPAETSIYPPIVADPDTIEDSLSIQKVLFMCVVATVLVCCAYASFAHIIMPQPDIIRGIQVFGIATFAWMAILYILWPRLARYWYARNRRRLATIHP